MRRAEALTCALRTAWRCATTPLSAILMYHRVASDPHDMWELCVSPENFAEQIEALVRSGFRFETVGEVAAALRRGSVSKMTIAISFDDGYADNFLVAYPVLRTMRVPATVFVTSAFVGGTREFWWDAVNRAFFTPEILPDTLHLLTPNGVLNVDLAGAAASAAGAAKRREAALRVWSSLSRMARPDRELAVEAVCAWAGVPTKARDSHRAMTLEELRRIAEDPRIEIGAHTMSHPDLTALSEEERRTELTASKSALEQALGRPVLGMSYPHGRHDADLVEAARDIGYAYACTSTPRVLGQREDAYRLPRLYVPDLTGANFSQHLVQKIAPARYRRLRQRLYKTGDGSSRPA